MLSGSIAKGNVTVVLWFSSGYLEYCLNQGSSRKHVALSNEIISRGFKKGTLNKAGRKMERNYKG